MVHAARLSAVLTVAAVKVVDMVAGSALVEEVDEVGLAPLRREAESKVMVAVEAVAAPAVVLVEMALGKTVYAAASEPPAALAAGAIGVAAAGTAGTAEAKTPAKAQAAGLAT